MSEALQFICDNRPRPFLPAAHHPGTSRCRCRRIRPLNTKRQFPETPHTGGASSGGAAIRPIATRMPRMPDDPRMIATWAASWRSSSNLGLTTTRWCFHERQRPEQWGGADPEFFESHGVLAWPQVWEGGIRAPLIGSDGPASLGISRICRRPFGDITLPTQFAELRGRARPRPALTASRSCRRCSTVRPERPAR